MQSIVGMGSVSPEVALDGYQPTGIGLTQSWWRLWWYSRRSNASSTRMCTLILLVMLVHGLKASLCCGASFSMHTVLLEVVIRDAHVMLTSKPCSPSVRFRIISKARSKYPGHCEFFLSRNIYDTEKIWLAQVQNPKGDPCYKPPDLTPRYFMMTASQ
jgi:hypothetical protein